MIPMVGKRKATTPSQYRRDFISRVKSARVMSGKTQAEMAEALSVKLNTYQTWEIRALLPHQHIVPFCQETGADLLFLLTGIPFDLGRALQTRAA